MLATSRIANEGVEFLLSHFFFFFRFKEHNKKFRYFFKKIKLSRNQEDTRKKCRDKLFIGDNKDDYKYKKSLSGLRA